MARLPIIGLLVAAAACCGRTTSSGAAAAGSSGGRAPAAAASGETAGAATQPRIALPLPQASGGPALARTLAQRRSVREYRAEPLTVAELAALLWAAQGVVDDRGRRTAPSAGALYPLELFVVASRIGALEAGVYRYEPAPHALVRVRPGDHATALSEAALSQAAIANAAASIVVTGHYEVTARKYGERAARYVHLEAGHASQNVLLEATALGLGAVPIGAFDDERVGDLVGAGGTPLCLIAVGRPAAP